MNMVGCTGLRGFRTQGHRDGGFGDNCPTTVAVSGGLVREIRYIPYDFFRSVMRFSPVLPK